VRTVFAVKVLLGCSAQMQLRVEPWTGGGGVAFRHLHVYAELVHAAMRTVRSGALTGIDQGPDVGVARGDDAAERGHDALERLELAQAAPHWRPAESAAAFLAAASPAFSSSSCLETDSVASNPFQRVLVVLDRASLARAVAKIGQRLAHLAGVDFGACRFRPNN